MATKFVYILTNPTIPDLIKIGKTDDIERRLKDLSSHAGVPVPFECFYCCEVENGEDVESRVHAGFGDQRINPRREFFRITPERVKNILELVAIRDVTPGADVVDSKEEQDSLNKARARRPVFTFSMVNIPIGSEIKFLKDEAKVAHITGDREIEYEGEKSSLSKVASELLKNQFGETMYKSIRGPDYWTFDNETLTERRLRLEEHEDE